MPKIGLKNIADADILQSVTPAIEGIEFSSVQVGVTYNNETEKVRIRKLLEKYFTDSLGKKIAKENFDIYFLLNVDRGIADATPSSVCIEGRYNKYSRDIAQTFHYCFRCKGRGCKNCNFSGKLTLLSVQELLDKKLLPLLKSHASKFHGCGREDVDVRMLGTGRPFVFEAVFPNKRSLDLGKMEKEMNSEYGGKIAVHGLKFCSPGRIVQIKNTEFKKIYSAKCSCEGKISVSDLKSFPKKGIKISQKTPERVEKRRAYKERAKTAQILRSKPDGESGFIFEILSSHGLYVKEFVSGDGDRTNPSISSLLGKKCVCKELDVLEIVTEK